MAGTAGGEVLDGPYEPSPPDRVRGQVAAYEPIDGAEGGTLEGRPLVTVILTGVGGSSGAVCKTPFTCVPDGERYFLVAPAAGAPTHPAWYRSILGHPYARVEDAIGAANALVYHATHEFGGDVTSLPAGRVWLDAINETPIHERHFAIHDQHLVGLNAADLRAWDDGSWQAIPHTTLTGSADQVKAQVAHIAAHGVTELIYQPAGSGIPGELAAIINTVGSASSGCD